ncbi:hypothetical protein PHYBLDRAFT_68860 [Phycomyces blakesleeanus NRRL 1555(-)]|uniref:Reverse transcriptase domain-containing protein n=1 Tax=Phycomyces blakesleeanus (strain ATCC 8743b / DSM 1359 / FGSC 10004 / NBRC 33097 / NRRL 1555) TaxID=763407 RepID=A0A162TG43_PHYB8|nr:hypothetical protein PHYBLDRAFT_68860 [Phycomyces blakesleeanus NRRL 1555(-)]OAD68312.1 hypothetical protein PHYBLDRAFT_68860 [Phycomyces blakesleeanus NRRL 1555(-)]|eukprot:XP_018286352.1 hypothetical protein PHYBLDRAFT_68860 [Phycomyces blakesleeanus NRRL 1555(-)]
MLTHISSTTSISVSNLTLTFILLSTCYQHLYLFKNSGIVSKPISSILSALIAVALAATLLQQKPSCRPSIMTDSTAAFYEDLYFPNDIEQSIVDDLLYIREGAQQSPSTSSPGPNRIPYEILCLLFDYSACAHILEKLYNDALTTGVFPASWQSTCLFLLPKKGDLTCLKNWRPIALINTDAKIFT